MTPETRHRIPRLALLFSLALSGSALGPAEGRAQGSQEALALECAGGDPAREPFCREIVLAARAARAGFAILASGGAADPGSASTIGYRVGSTPRVSLSIRLQGADVAFPALPSGGDPVPTDPLPRSDFFGSALRLGASVGIFDGFSPVPTMGGVLAVDVVGDGNVLFLPDDRGFSGSETAWGIGARIGIFRESFSLPGVTVSAVHRWGSTVRIGRGGAAAGAAAVEPSVTSFRATVGKDLAGVALLAGTGWDELGGDLSVGTETPAPGDSWDAATGSLSDSRPVIFAGAALNYLVVRISAEAGWAGGMDALPDRGEGGFDPESGSWFGGVALRLVY